jgi:hypothetical protein
MEKLLFFSSTIDQAGLSQQIPSTTIHPVSSKRELALAIIEETDVRSALVELEALSDEYREFFISLQKHFPLLHTGIIMAHKQNIPLGKLILERDADNQPLASVAVLNNKGDHDLFDIISDFLEKPVKQNKRKHPRFDWILNGYLSNPAEGGEEQKYKISSFGPGGAFLESEKHIPEPGSRAQIRILFQNFQMEVGCEILDPRYSSSNMPTGFGIRFIDLSSESEAAITNIINDAIFKILIDPQHEPEVPSLDEEELTPDFSLL